jgi:hypothetical protein
MILPVPRAVASAWLPLAVAFSACGGASNRAEPTPVAAAPSSPPVASSSPSEPPRAATQPPPESAAPAQFAPPASAAPASPPATPPPIEAGPLAAVMLEPTIGCRPKVVTTALFADPHALAQTLSRGCTVENDFGAARVVAVVVPDGYRVSGFALECAKGCPSATLRIQWMSAASCPGGAPHEQLLDPTLAPLRPPAPAPPTVLYFRVPRVVTKLAGTTPSTVVVGPVCPQPRAR